MNVQKLYQELRRCLPQQPHIDNAGDYLASAVVLPLVEDKGEISVLFEVRSQQLNRQPGEVCFPGGRIEAGESPLAAAVRETAEELTISKDNVDILGPLPIIASPIGVLLFPFVGILSSAEISPSNVEVAECFTIPLSFLLNTQPVIGHMEVATRPLADIPFEMLPDDYSRRWKRRAAYPVWFYRYETRVVWGLTARVLATFLEACRNTGR